ncbi:MAG: 2-succinyl-5-enolpyruvyl-6-hydroxy-3-cyclohexene-1-carboxylic-acid synthase [Actinobacteria bacterium]|nr:2-succinyl-5-enolpyruvyl-6-hydroxy-3-cyclohexene-1-carboxylic-acid synthase [Actinomycetota bacterium]
MLHAENLNALWASLLVEELVRNGVTYFCISPGSRSTPLTIAAARNPNVRKLICIDERGAGFHALGYGRATGKPAAVIATSGTAVANYYPAVVEASMDGVPLLVLSADRPPELRETGANQTIRQPGMFANYLRWQFDFPTPDEKIPPQMVLTTVDQAVYRMLRSPVGPVHLNFMFREPLAPSLQSIGEKYLGGLKTWRENAIPYTKYLLPRSMPDAESLDETVATLKRSERGLLVVGRLHSLQESEAVFNLSQKLRWSVFADIASGLRLGNAANINYFDQLLLSEKFKAEIKPDVILHIGGQLTSKRFLQFAEANAGMKYIHIVDHPFRHDPSHLVDLRIEADIPAFCDRVSEQIKKPEKPKDDSPAEQKSRLVENIVAAFLNKDKNISEPAVARIISQNIPKNHALFLSNSMPIRDMDMYADPGGNRVPVGTNRGASGIDGLIAGAAGFAAGLERPTTLLIGDLSFLHDLNSLALLQKNSQPLVIVLINNQGGGIFSFLPVAEFKDVFDYFATPHELHFKNAADLFKIPWFAPQNTDDFTHIYRQAVENERTTLIEVQTLKNENIDLHKRLQQQIMTALKGT